MATVGRGTVSKKDVGGRVLATNGYSISCIYQGAGAGSIGLEAGPGRGGVHKPEPAAFVNERYSAILGAIENIRQRQISTKVRQSDGEAGLSANGVTDAIKDGMSGGGARFSVANLL